MTDLKLQLNPSHDVQRYRKIYARDGVIRVENLFPDDIAKQIYDILSLSTPWHLVHSDPAGRHKYYSPEEWDAIPAAQKQAVFRETHERASMGFAYLYLCYPMISAYIAKRNPEWPLHQMTEFLNSPEMLDFTRAITNEPSVIKHSAQATFYGRGHFLNIHDDTDQGQRRAAYVMGFSKDWRPDWGGQLLFLDGDDIEKGFSPSFNSLTIFKVPVRHIVTQVTNFAGAGRYSITGWLEDDP